MKTTFLLAVFCILFTGQPFAQSKFPPAFEISADTATSIMLPWASWQYIVENDKELTLSDVLSPRFSALFKLAGTSAGNTQLISKIWLRYKIKNNLNRPLGITINDSVGKASVYIAGRSGKWQRYITGYRIPWSKRDGLKKLGFVRYTIPPNEDITVYERNEDIYNMQVLNNGLYIGIEANEIKKNYVNNEDEHVHEITGSFLSGLMFFAFVVNLFFFFIVRERVYLYYCLLLLLGTVILAPIFSLLTKEISYHNLIQKMIGGLILYLFMVTVLQFLQVANNHPKWNRALLVISTGLYILTLINIGMQFFPLHSATEADLLRWLFWPFEVLINFCVLVLIVIIIADLIKKHRSAKLFIIAILPFLCYLLFSVFFDVPFVGDVVFIWGVIVMSWSLFDRFKSVLNENARQALERERLLREKEEERNQLIAQQNEQLEIQVTERTAELNQSLVNLKQTQNQLIQSEKMASLGELTAGIAHEIQNPLNFVNNFSEVNREMLEELKTESEKPRAERDEALEAELINGVIENERKINQHGKRADAIVKGMLQHSKAGSGVRELTDINALVEECLAIAYKAVRTKDKLFNAQLVTNFYPAMPQVNIMARDINHVLLNIFNNAFYAVKQQQKKAGEGYHPQINVTTLTEKGQAIIKIRDNGTGFPANIKDKIMQPFFTTKPTGEGSTGLGLSLSYDIVVKGHNGRLSADSVEGEGAEFVIQVPV